MNSLLQYLKKYYKYQQEITLVSRLTSNSWWNDRCEYLGEKYVSRKHYNHRSVLDNEVVIEFDLEDVAANQELSRKVEKRLKEDKVAHSVWFSGGKSTHIHLLINTKKCSNIR